MSGAIRLDRLAPASFSLPADELKVWYAPCDGFSDESLRRQRRLLSPVENRRADAFKFDRDRRSYLVTHLALRLVLAGALACPPEALDIVYDERGRPKLASAGGPRLSFSLSHCLSAGLLSVSNEPRLGVDIERLDRNVPLELAAKLFSPAESQSIASADERLRAKLFLEIWTLKEAFAKAMGLGLLLPLDRSSFSIDRSTHRVDAVLDESLGESASAWHFRSFVVAGHQCGLAVHRQSHGQADLPLSVAELRDRGPRSPGERSA